MALTAEQQKHREDKITASFLPYLMAGDEKKILTEWQRIVGDPNYAPEDLSEIWAVQFGSWIEPFALDWHQHKTGRALIRRGEFIKHPSREFFGCTLDAYREDDKAVIDCKAPGQWRKLDDVIQHYTPQMVGQAACMKTAKAALLIVHGGSEPVEYPIEWTKEYEAELWNRVDEFQACVESLTPPVSLPAVAAPVKAIKIVDMSESNVWGNYAAVWLRAKDEAEQFNLAVKELKNLVPADAMKATGHGIVASRNKGGALSIKAEK